MGPARPRFTPIYNVFFESDIMTENLKWVYMVDYMTDSKRASLANSVAVTLAETVGKVQPKGRRYNLLTKPIPQ